MLLGEIFLSAQEWGIYKLTERVAAYTATTEGQVKQGPSAIRMKGYEFPS